MSPTCCEASETNRTVRFFVPCVQATPGNWVVPIRGDDGSISDVMNTGALFCPFCGAELGREHIPFEAREPHGAPPVRPVAPGDGR